MTISALRTPDDCFAGLRQFPFKPNYIDTLEGYENLRIHYVDEGPVDADEVFLCLHGEPTWSFLYRKMIPRFRDAGARVICPDWLGFGRSDKPVDDDVYIFHFHRNMMLAFIKALNLRNITLVVQDWGGILGLTLPMDMPDQFSRLLVMNTALPTGVPVSEGFAAWRAFAASEPDLDVGALMKRAVPGLSPEDAAAYSAPFPDLRFKAGVRRFPQLVMTAPGMDGVETARRARAWWAHEWAGQSFMAVGMQDNVLGLPVMEELRTIIRGCPPPLRIDHAGHFVQESGDEIARAALAHWKAV